MSNKETLTVVNNASVKAIASLTERETGILQLASNGFTTLEIAEQVFLSKDTVESHRKNIIKKMKVKNITHAVAVAMRQQLIY